MNIRRPFLALPSLRAHIFIKPQQGIIQLTIRNYASSSNRPPSKKAPSQPPSIKQDKNLPESFKKTIPGETTQSNSIMERLPTFPLRNNSTLLPKPGVPTSTTHSLRSMLEILNNKRQPELIYEAEPHRLYFLFCGAFAFVFALYGITFFEWSTHTAYDFYKQDGDLSLFLGRLGVNILIASVAGLLVTGAMMLPTRLVRRIYYLPGRVEHIRFTSHPILPGRTTPVHTIPLSSFNRSKRGRIFTKNGIYGTLDKSSLFFVLKEQDKRFGYWIVDRNGWFWGDGRIFDVLFGKESLAEAEKALTYDEKFGQATQKLKEEKQALREEHGKGWKLKVGADMIRDDIKRVGEKLKARDKQLQNINKNDAKLSKKSKSSTKRK